MSKPYFLHAVMVWGAVDGTLLLAGEVAWQFRVWQIDTDEGLIFERFPENPPQLWTLLKGEMSFVQARPEVPQFVADFDEHLPYYAERHMVKPGISGWAQIDSPCGTSIEDARRKLEHDFYYAKNFTPFHGILILIQTFRVILWPEGAR